MRARFHSAPFIVKQANQKTTTTKTTKETKEKMNTTQHTPGPWVYDSFGHTSFAFNDNREDYSARIEWAPDMSDEEVDANARLISAAPALLSALELAADELDQWIGNDYADEKTHAAQNAARAAIAKARGGAK
jgi:hypothetical protein